MKLPRPTNAPFYRSMVRASFPVRRMIGHVIPDSVALRARGALGLVQPKTIELERLQLIREAPLARLREVAFLEHELLPALGLSDDAAELFPPHLRAYAGVGLRHWQYPSQFSRYLVELSRHAIDSYLEIGVQHGGTFAITVEYLQRFHPLRATYAIDVNRVPSLKRYAAQNGTVHVMREDSSTERFSEFVRRRGPFGLVLIDGDHSEEACRRDFEAVAEHASMIAIHDIVDEGWPGVGIVWRDIKQRRSHEFDFHEFIEQYDEVQQRLPRPSLGIGLAIVRS